MNEEMKWSQDWTISEGIPAEIFDRGDHLRQLFTFFLIENQLRYLISHRSPHFFFFFNLKIRPLYQTLSKALEISRKIPVTLKPRDKLICSF